VIELASVIRDLRIELEQAVAAVGDDAALRFELGPVELEVSVAIERSATAEARVRFWVVDASGSGKVGSTGTQRVKLALTPKLNPDVHPPYVAGAAVPGER
jgi:hypothetical protein